jgi:hypothetical protein
VGAAVSAILLATNNRGNNNDGGGTSAELTTQAAPAPAPVSDTAAAPATTEKAAPTTTVAPTTTAVPTTAPTTTEAAAPTTDPVAFVQSYYDNLPGNPEASLAMLAPEGVAKSGGRQGFINFYAEMSSVTLTGARSSGPDTVDGTVNFTKKTGEVTHEPYRFFLTTGDNGTTIMRTFQKL